MVQSRVYSPPRMGVLCVTELHTFGHRGRLAVPGLPSHEDSFTTAKTVDRVEARPPEDAGDTQPQLWSRPRSQLLPFDWIAQIENPGLTSLALPQGSAWTGGRWAC